MTTFDEMFPRPECAIEPFEIGPGEFVLGCPDKPLTEKEARDVVIAYETLRNLLRELLPGMAAAPRKRTRMRRKGHK
jgi:hypothetical protein